MTLTIVCLLPGDPGLNCTSVQTNNGEIDGKPQEDIEACKSNETEESVGIEIRCRRENFLEFFLALSESENAHY